MKNEAVEYKHPIGVEKTSSTQLELDLEAKNCEVTYLREIVIPTDNKEPVKTLEDGAPNEGAIGGYPSN